LWRGIVKGKGKTIRNVQANAMMADNTVKKSIIHTTIASLCLALLSATSFLKNLIVLFMHC